MSNDILIRFCCALFVLILFGTFWVNWFEIKLQEKKDDAEGGQS
jgi:hypothetical protein